MMSTKQIFLAILASALFFSCEKPIFLDVPLDGYKIVINGVLTPDSTMKVHISQSLASTDQYPYKGVPDVVAVVYEDGMLFDTLKADSTSMYRSQKKVLAGKEYTIKAKHRIMESAEAQTITGDAPIFSFAGFESIINPETGGKWLLCKFNLNDNSSLQDYYSITVDGYMIWKNVNSYGYSTDPHMHGYPTNNYGYSSEYGLEPLSVFYRNGTFLNKEEFQDNSWNSYRGELTFNDMLLNSSNPQVEFLLKYALDSSKTIEVEISRLDKNYHQYFESLSRQHLNNEIFAEPVPMYSNIRNGYGIFTTASRKKIEIEIPDSLMPTDIFENSYYFYEYE